MTDLSAGSEGSCSGDRLVYVPLDALPKELLSKLGDFKVIIKDDNDGDRILPKERLGEVIAELNRDRSKARVASPNDDIFTDLTAQRVASRSPPNSPDTTTNRQPERDMFQFSSSVGPPASPREISPTPTLQGETDFKSRKRKMEETDPLFRKLTENRTHSPAYENQRRTNVRSDSSNYDTESADFYSGPNYGSRTQARVTMDAEHDLQTFQTMLETTPRKPIHRHEELIDMPLRKSPRVDEPGPWDYVRTPARYRDQPTPNEMSSARLHAQRNDVVRARKQLFNSPRHSSEMRLHDLSDYMDSQKENHYQAPSSPRRRQYPPYPYSEDDVRSPGGSRVVHHIESPRGYKRKQAFVDEMQFTTPYQNQEGFGNARMPTEGMSDRLLEMLQPSKRHCHDYSDIGPSQNKDHKVKCACSMMETHFLQMTECAYRNIRRKDSSRESFEQFNHELAQTNSVLKESVNILRTIQQICTHRDVHSERLRS